MSYSPLTNFDVQWVIKNTRKHKWLAAETQFHDVDGVKMQKFGDTVNLNTDVAPDASCTVGIDLVPASSAGACRITYSKAYICTLTMNVVIK